MSDIVNYSTNELMQEKSYETFLYVLAHKEEFENFEKKFKRALLTEMEAQGITSFESDKIKVTYKAATTRKSVDTEKLKEQGLYDMFTKESPVSASVIIKIK